MGVHFIDCRSAQTKKFAGQPRREIGEYAWCEATLQEKFEGFTSFRREQGGGNNSMWNAERVVRAGNVIVTGDAFERPKAGEKWKLAQLDAVMSEVDWATIAKW
ncbi:hypothetical protein BH09MYX1_BH09MYX1_66900 [soil metagenome]